MGELVTGLHSEDNTHTHTRGDEMTVLVPEQRNTSHLQASHTKRKCSSLDNLQILQAGVLNVIMLE